MKRWPVEYRATAVADAELQADVMRFVAILALCLVAISTLVDTDREQPEPVRPAPVSVPEPVRNGTSAPPQATPDHPMAVGGADHSPHPVSPGGREIATSPPEVKYEPSSPPAVERPSPVQGLSLRFATDAALLRMAARGEAQVFALSEARTLTLDLSDGIDFKPASAPASYYSMSPDTVPALLRAAYHGPGDAQWGVTLPGNTTAAIEEHLGGSASGVLVIDAAGTVTLEPADE